MGHSPLCFTACAFLSLPASVKNLSSNTKRDIHEFLDAARSSRLLPQTRVPAYPQRAAAPARILEPAESWAVQLDPAVRQSSSPLVVSPTPPFHAFTQTSTATPHGTERNNLRLTRSTIPPCRSHPLSNGNEIFHPKATDAVRALGHRLRGRQASLASSYVGHLVNSSVERQDATRGGRPPENPQPTTAEDGRLADASPSLS